jgi:nucleoside 2-deoxyribosyltransferase
MKIYLASPFFNGEELTIYKQVIRQLRDTGHEVYVPQEHSIEGAWDMSNVRWARAVYREDIKAIDKCECVMILNFGMYSDSGTAWEAGYANALRKYTVQVLCGGDNATYSLMMINGCDKVVDLDNVVYFEEVSARANLSKVIQK